MRTLAITRLNLVRLFRDRGTVFVLFVLPFLIVLLLGASAGGASTPELGFVAPSPDALTDQLLAGLQAVDGLDVVVLDDEEVATRGVERGELRAALVLPVGYEATLRAGGDADIRYVGRSGEENAGLTEVIQSVVTQQATLLRTARFAVDQGYGTFEEALPLAEQVQAELPPVEVIATTAGEAWVLAGLGQFDLYAQNMLVLFIFMTTLSAAVYLVQTRLLGISKRMYSTPTTIRTAIAGEGLSRFTIAMLQGLIIFGGTWLFFGVDWGNGWASALTIVVFALVATGAAMLLGAFASNERQANGLGTTLGLMLAALGGAMFPLAVLKVLSEPVYNVAHVAPHAWALEAFQKLIAEAGGLGDIAVFLLILLGYAAVFFALAVWRLRVVLVR